MDASTLSALRGSIRKWEKIVAQKGVDRGVDNCPLCDLFYQGACIGCPVMEKTGLDSCDGSPYEDWCYHHCSHGSGMFDDLFADQPCCVEHAKAELEFLKSLMPQDMKP